MILRNYYGEFLNQFHWDWYCTLTFKKEVSPRTAFKLFNVWKIKLKKATGHRIDYAMVIEPTPLRNSIPHLYLLLSGSDSEKPYIWEQQWYRIGGKAKIEYYDSNRGASYYLGNKMAVGVAYVIFSKNLSRLPVV